MPDPIRKRVGYGQLWPLRPAFSQNQAGPYMPGPTSRIRCSTVFPKKAWIISRKTDPDPIWMAWSGLNTSGLEASRCAGIIWPGFWQEATGPLPISHFQTRFRSSTDIPDNTAQKPARIRFSSGRFCHVLAKGLLSGSKPTCKNHPARFRPVLPSRTGPAANRIRHVYWVAICLPM